MPLTKEQIIEVQTAAKFNYKRRLQEIEDQKKLKEEVANAIKEAKSASTVSEKKGK